MKRLAARVLLPLAAAAALTGLTGGVAGADPVQGPVWLVPGADLGGVLGPLGQPVGLLAPVFDLITAVS
ncbi:hypothetical protein [Amycolatopsis vancoresmycina]|uniref:Secreted protein n=1 Tax=Amycolatopsis vancoresmycina DSM 44592 TaxID=1292037 RepID=R1HXY3_9PSEU|nr:hypothetical protein [Amycolatopsis vancoresmycina]EOD65196.1 hypothetical protein H480_28016 [Amycolatopsis vancoresmycina DSM 44592]